ncbi:GntR family transcriptional regulator [Neptunicoccus sediminis]|uniref:GntR family transcriptional regulator n=1 Tax=Neptunicoccus sediminis TaxID=1892596 RepID=UPI00084601D0|nr:GntR family transcriptional regulator [Neptunicoccus sediminis]
MRISYRDVKAEILNRIRNNTWPLGTNLPGEIELAKEFGCARATMNRAMRDLVDDGILERKRKAGTKVKQSLVRQAQFSISIVREEVEQSGAVYSYSLIEREQIPAPAWLRERINVAKDAPILHLKCMHYSGKNPYQFEDRWINLDVVPAAKDYDFEEIGPNEWLIQQIPFTTGELVFSATNASENIARFLKAPVDTALFSVERTTWLEDKSVTYAQLYFARDHKMTTSI